MRSPIVASVTLVAVIAVPVAAVAATKHHHKAHLATYHHAAYHHSIRAAYGMYDPPRTQLLAPISMCEGAYLNTVTVELCDNLAVNGL